jgi:ABC-type nitrate/sulfonate/bicarbonate transport system substrate-binding protein
MPTTLQAPADQLLQTQLDIWYTRCPVPTPFGLALHLGLFDEEFAGDDHIAIKALQQSNDPKVHQSHYTHTQPNSFRHGGSYPALWAQSSGADIRVIGLSWLPDGNTILTLPDSSIKSPSDLRGKRLLVIRRPAENIDYAYATTLRNFEVALRSVGLELGNVQLVEHRVDRAYISDRFQHGSPDYVSFRKGKSGLGRWDELLGPLIRGEVDAISAGSLQSEQLEELFGLKVIFNTASLPNQADRANNSSPFTFAVKADLIEKHPEVVARFYARSLEAFEWARHHEKDVIRYTAREQSVPEKIVENVYGKSIVAGLETDLSPAKIESLRTLKDFLLRHGIIPRDFDVNQWIDPRPLALARELLEERRKSSDFIGHASEAKGRQIAYQPAHR